MLEQARQNYVLSIRDRTSRVVSCRANWNLHLTVNVRSNALCVCVLWLDRSSIARYSLGEMFSDTVPGHGFTHAQFRLDSPTSLRVTVSVPRGAVAGFYARRDAPPSFTRFDVFQVVDGTKVVGPQTTSRRRRRRSPANPDAAAVTGSAVYSVISDIFKILIVIKLCLSLLILHLFFSFPLRDSSFKSFNFAIYFLWDNIKARVLKN